MSARRFFRKLAGRKITGLYELSTPKIHRRVLGAIEDSGQQLTGNCLDIGSGGGQLLRLIAARYSLTSFACDYLDGLMETPGQKVELINLNRESLPYPDGHFALVTCIETIEHLENFRAIVREIYRVLKPGGLAVISTPNVLNLRSRLRYFSSGFYNLFGPLAPEESRLPGPPGHITPVNWFYLAHAMQSVGFQHIRPTVDKYQRRSVPAFVFFAVPIHLMNWAVQRRDATKYQTLNDKNRWAVRLMNSRDLLLGRTLIVTATKPV
ncbi:MAG TPA: class I SAM-dependent methyltransferase [Chthoniobacterales bacterium]|nr:class I SAM-dependent methyltransferase [Chthoniobacterales bacterium]